MVHRHQWLHARPQALAKVTHAALQLILHSSRILNSSTFMLCIGAPFALQACASMVHALVITEPCRLRSQTDMCICSQQEACTSSLCIVDRPCMQTQVGESGSGSIPLLECAAGPAASASPGTSASPPGPYAERTWATNCAYVQDAFTWHNLRQLSNGC